MRRVAIDVALDVEGVAHREDVDVHDGLGLGKRAALRFRRGDERGLAGDAAGLLMREGELTLDGADEFAGDARVVGGGFPKRILDGIEPGRHVVRKRALVGQPHRQNNRLTFFPTERVGLLDFLTHHVAVHGSLGDQDDKVVARGKLALDFLSPSSADGRLDIAEDIEPGGGEFGLEECGDRVVGRFAAVADEDLVSHRPSVAENGGKSRARDEANLRGRD